MGENMLNINVLYIYPEIMEINNEINLVRIVDNNIKETLVIYAERENEYFRIIMINTMSGETKIITQISEVKIKEFVNEIKIKEKEFVILKDLNKVEEYISNLRIY